MANVYDLLNQGTSGNAGLNNTDLLPAEENNEVSTIASVFAGIGSGLIDIPKGLFSLGASIYDLTNDTNKAAEIEKYFDDLRNFDEAYLNLSAKGTVTAKLFDTLARQEGISELPNVDIETLEVGETFYIPGAKSLARIVLKEGKKDLIQTPY